MVTDAQLDTFLAGCKARREAYNVESGYTDATVTMGFRRASRYIKVFMNNSIFCFIDQNGDILKPASFNVPAKHARGNLNDDKQGLGLIGPYGPAYLR